MIPHTRTSATDRTWLVRKEPNPINRLLLEVTFSFIMALGGSLAPWFSSHDGGYLKRCRFEAGETRCALKDKGFWGLREICGLLPAGWLMALAVQPQSVHPCLSRCPGAGWFYATTFMSACNGRVPLKTNGRPVKCKGFMGKPPIRGPTTRFIYSSHRRDAGCHFLYVNKANFLFYFKRFFI